VCRFVRHHRRMQCRMSAMKYAGRVSCWRHFLGAGPTVASIWEATRKTRAKNRSWEDGADESDDMVVWASHACESWAVAAIADDCHSDIES
jgi:hypothetical protein